MNIVYFPNMFLTDETLLKELLLSWGRVETIVPPSQKQYIDAYLSGEITQETHFPLEQYKEIYDLAGEPIVDFLVIDDEERRRASNRMLDAVANWNADTHFYDDLKVHSVDDLMGQTVEWYWMYHEKLESDLVELLMQEHLVLHWGDGEIVGKQPVGKSYMSIIAAEIKRSREARIITDDSYYLAAKSGAELVRTEEEDDGGLQPVALAIPQAYLAPDTLQGLAWSEVVKIRSELLPYAAQYYQEVEGYQGRINEHALKGQTDEAYDIFREFCDRVNTSFQPFAKERGRIIRHSKDAAMLTLLTGILLPTTKLLLPDGGLNAVCDIATIAATASGYAFNKMNPAVGFEYLENLSRELDLARMQQQLSCLIPKSLKS